MLLQQTTSKNALSGLCVPSPVFSQCYQPVHCSSPRLSSICPVFTHDFQSLAWSLNSISLLSPLLSSSNIPRAPSHRSSPALVLSTCCNLANFLPSASFFIDLYGVISSTEGKDFFDTPKDQPGHKSHGQLLFDVDNFIPIQFPGFSNSCRSVNSKHLS